MILISFLIWLFPIPESGEGRLQSPPWAPPPMQSALCSYRVTGPPLKKFKYGKPRWIYLDAICYLLIQVRCFGCIKQARKSRHKCTGKTWTTVRLPAGRLNRMLEQMSDRMSGSWVISQLGCQIKFWIRSQIGCRMKCQIGCRVIDYQNIFIWNATFESFTQWVSHDDLY